ncbi:glycosyltransferase family 2 protein [Parabacteroides sp.]
MMNTITAILTVWKRNHLEEQLLALLGQTLSPQVIWVQQTQHHVDVDDVIYKYRNYIKYTCWEDNPGVFGRFESVENIDTQYVYIVDDDIIPGSGYLEKALETSKRLNAIISPNGRLLNIRNDRTEVYVGDGYEFQHCFCAVDREVDFGNNSWFLKKEWIDFFLQEKPLFRNNGEDIHLSATCKLLGNIPTIVPRQIKPYESGNIKRIYSADEYALHRKMGFSRERVKVIQKFRSSGWILQQEKVLI